MRLGFDRWKELRLPREERQERREERRGRGGGPGGGERGGRPAPGPPRPRAGRGGGAGGGGGGSLWRWSLRRLWVAVISRHSVRTAPRPRRLKRFRRLNFICANTGSIIGWRLR